MKLHVGYALLLCCIVTCFAPELQDPMRGLPGLQGPGVGAQKFDPMQAPPTPQQPVDHKSFEQIMAQVSPEERAMMEQMLTMFPPGEGEQLIEELFNMPPEQLTELVTQANQVLQEQNIDINQIEQALAEGNWPPPELMQPYDMEPYVPPVAPSAPPAVYTPVPEKKIVEPFTASKEKAAAQKLQQMGQQIVHALQSLQIKSLEEESIAKKIQPHQLQIADLIFYIETLTHQATVQMLKLEEVENFSKKLERLYDVLNRYEPQIVITRVESTDFFDPYIILGIAPSATTEQIEQRYQQIRQEKDPEIVRTTKNLSEKELQKLRAAFKQIKKAYSMISDEQSRAEYDRIIKARALNNNRLESAAQRALQQVIQALEEAFFVTDINTHAKGLATTYAATAVEERKKQLALEEQAAKKIEESRKERQAAPTTVPGAGGFGGFGDGGFGYPGLGAGYPGTGGGGYTPAQPSFPATPQAAPTSGSQGQQRQPTPDAQQKKTDDKKKKKKKQKKQTLKKRSKTKAAAAKKPLGYLKDYVTYIDKPEFIAQCTALLQYLQSNDPATVKEDAVLAQELKKLEEELALSKFKELLVGFADVLKDKPEDVKIQAKRKWFSLQEKHKQIIEPLFKLLSLPQEAISPLKQFLHYGIEDVELPEGAPELNNPGVSFKQFQDRYKPLLELLEQLAIVDINAVVKGLTDTLAQIDKTELRTALDKLYEYMTDDSEVRSAEFTQRLQALIPQTAQGGLLRIDVLFAYLQGLKLGMPMATSQEAVTEAEQKFQALIKKHKPLFDKLEKLTTLLPEDMTAPKRFAHGGDATALTQQEQTQLGIPTSNTFIQFQDLLGELDGMRKGIKFVFTPMPQKLTKQQRALARQQQMAQQNLQQQIPQQPGQQQRPGQPPKR